MYSIVVQYAADKSLAPKKSLLTKWAKRALRSKIKDAEVTIRIVDVQEMTTLNTTFRKKNGTTNVLSFPFSMPEEIDLGIPILGDIVICAEVVNQEAQEQHKPRETHWAHMVIHGVFHLLGYDHETEEEADEMESLEIEILGSLGFENPYATGENHS